MECIAVVDDKADFRGTVVKFIVKELKKLGVDWAVIDSPPLPSMDDYSAWVEDNDVLVLVLDEKLADEIHGDAAVDYSGHDVATLLRRQRPDLPQMIVSAVVDEDDVESAGELDAVVERDDFMRHADIYVARMVRLGMTYAERHGAELAELTRLSEKVVKEPLVHDERERLDALRAKMQSIVSASNQDGLSGWLEDARAVQNSLQQLLDELRGV